jgi:hypothetical protein
MKASVESKCSFLRYVHRALLVVEMSDGVILTTAGANSYVLKKNASSVTITYSS